MNPNQTPQPTPAPVPSVDAATIHLIIKGAILIALVSLLSGIFLACFVLYWVSTQPESGQVAAVIMTAAAGLLGVPAIAQTGLLALLARTRTDPPAPTGTPSDPVSVAGAAPSADAPPVETQDTNDPMKEESK